MQSHKKQRKRWILFFTAGRGNVLRMSASMVCVAVAVSVMLAFVTVFTAYAHDVPDMNRKGSVHISMHQGQTVVPGGTLTLYLAGEAYEDNGDYSFVPATAFAGWGGALEDIQSEELAESLAGYVKEQGLAGETLEIDVRGEVTFVGLNPGLYLLIQETAAEGYNNAVPFLVSVPVLENGIYIYDVDATPKVGDVTTKPYTPVKPEGTKDTKLPQTGQLKWPVPVMTIAGLVLFITGWMLRFGRKRDYDAV